MPIIEIPDDAMITIRKAAGDLPSDDALHAILYICGIKLGQDVQLEELKKASTRPRRGERSETAKLVQIDPMFDSRHSHAGWGADCPTCHQYIHEDIDTEPMPAEERLKACDYCEQKIELLYPWEFTKRVLELQDAKRHSERVDSGRPDDSNAGGATGG